MSPRSLLSRKGWRRKTVLLVGNAHHVCGLVAVADRIRPDAREVVRQLHGAGILHVVMLTGDAQPLAPVRRLNLIDAIEKIANESAHPVSKAALRRRLFAMGLPTKKLNNYFYQAIRRLRSKGRISVLNDGSIWRPRR